MDKVSGSLDEQTWEGASGLLAPKDPSLPDAQYIPLSLCVVCVTHFYF